MPYSSPSTLSRSDAMAHWLPVSRQDRLRIDQFLPLQATEVEVAGQDVIQGLTRRPKSLPPKYFYDDRGSHLFEQITTLPEYYLTRTETAILQASAHPIADIVGDCELVELGSGSSTKTRHLLSAFSQAGHTLSYCPVDVSGGMLEVTAHQLLQDYPQLTIHGLVGTYGPALTYLPQPELPRRMIAFIGSTLGNLNPQECQNLLAQMSVNLRGGDYLLLGVDLQKDTTILERAYNDSQGVTAAFNLNMLHHLNWRFDGNFQPNQFRHIAFYNEIAHQIEIYLESQTTQQVTLNTLNLTVNFDKKERLLSEISRKFSVEELSKNLRAEGLHPVKVFTDSQQWFGLVLCQKQQQ
jgi:L-histidine N-alpha-methyltransferase